jgi:hypothetical protein
LALRYMCDTIFDFKFGWSAIVQNQSGSLKRVKNLELFFIADNGGIHIHHNL